MEHADADGEHSLCSTSRPCSGPVTEPWEQSSMAGAEAGGLTSPE